MKALPLICLVRFCAECRERILAGDLCSYSCSQDKVFFNERRGGYIEAKYRLESEERKGGQ